MLMGSIRKLINFILLHNNTKVFYSNEKGKNFHHRRVGERRKSMETETVSSISRIMFPGNLMCRCYLHKNPIAKANSICVEKREFTVLRNKCQSRL